VPLNGSGECASILERLAHNIAERDFAAA